MTLMVAIELRRAKVLLNKPSNFSMIILDFNQVCNAGLQKTDFLPVQTDFYFVKPIQFA